MLILAIETTGPLASAALYDDGMVSFVRNSSDFSHLQECVPMIKALLSEEETDPAQLDAVAVSCGPGSFTGIRIGMATAKGLAQIWDKPVIEVPTLESFAWADLPFTRSTLICPVFDARRSQVYAGAYEPGSRTAVVEDSAWDPDELISRLRDVSGAYDRIVFFGDGIEPWKEKIEGSGLVFETAPEDARYQTACQAARLAAVMYGAGELCDCYTASPEYLRLAEAERKLAEKDR